MRLAIMVFRRRDFIHAGVVLNVRSALADIDDCGIDDWRGRAYKSQSASKMNRCRSLTLRILLDDASVPTDRFDQKHWEALQAPLAEYCLFAARRSGFRSGGLQSIGFLVGIAVTKYYYFCRCIAGAAVLWVESLWC